MPKQKIADALKSAGLARYVNVTEDGSCGWEVRVLLPEDCYVDVLTNICHVLQNMGFKTNEKCGTHVHFDMRNRDVKMVYTNLFKTQKLLRKFITRNRKHNTYCKMNHKETFDEQLACQDRYYCFNVESFARHKTLEVRMHQGTLDASELTPWINFLLKIVNYQQKVDKEVNTLKQAAAQFSVDKDLGSVLKKRLMSLTTKKLTGLVPEIPF